jgi:hypothetical protein
MGTATPTRTAWTLTGYVPGSHAQEFYTFVVRDSDKIAVYRHNTPTIPAEPYAVWTAQTARNLWNSCISYNWTLA